MAELQQDRSGGDELLPRPENNRTEHFDYVVVGYTDRADLDDFIDGEGGNLVVRGPIHTGSSVGELETMGAGATSGTPCLVVPLIHERIDQIQREVRTALHSFQERWEPGIAGGGRGRGEEAREGARMRGQGMRSSAGARTRGRDKGETSGSRQHHRTIGDTGGTARGTSSGAIRKGSLGPRGS